MMRELFVDQSATLIEICQRLSHSEWFALDTEFIRDRTYYPRLCLLQIADDGFVVCVDVLALDDLQPLLDVIYNPEITKIVHGAQQDLEALHHLHGRPPPRVFDTQIAATVLGYGDQIGYAKLVNAVLGVELDKSLTRTDWSQRPLDPEQLRYAANDVRHLRDLFRTLRQNLIDRGRWDWLDTDMQALSDPARYQLSPESAWLKVKRHNSLRGVQLATLQALASWREQEAAARNQPRRWIVSDEVLIELARRNYREPAELLQLRGLKDSQLRHHGAKLVEIAALGRTRPKNQWPSLPQRQRLTAEQEALTDVLMAIVRLRGLDNDVNPGILANRRDIERLLTGERDLPLLQGWRARVAGRAVLNYLDGSVCLALRDGKLQSLPAREIT
jgi:ribonuclease D